MRRMRRRFVVAIAALVVIAVAITIAGVRVWRADVEVSAPQANEAPTCTTTTVPRATSSPTTRTAPTTVSTTTTTTSPPAPPLLARGAVGDEVVVLQTRLRDLGYWLESVNGTFDSETTHAVIAFQKTKGLERDGVVGPATRAALATATRPGARSTSGHVIEIDLTRQLLLDVSNGRVTWAFDTSTGAIAGTTPRGHWQVFREVDGYVYGSLGVLYRPQFFHGNVAIHGNPNVPPYPASHGCVRLTNAATDWLWASGDLALGTAVWVY